VNIAGILAEQRRRSAFLDPAKRGAIYLEWAAHHVRKGMRDAGQGEALATGLLFVAGVLRETNRRQAEALEALGKIGGEA
jgi:hypothetical protein